jgi:hypothetical protein
MDAPDLTGPLRWLRVALPLALTLAIGGLAACALNAYPVGYALFGLAGIMAGAAFAFLLALKNRTAAYLRLTQAKQRTDLDRVFRSGTW